MADASTDDIDVKRYDRQIRLWGLDTQRGLLGARILFVGVDGLMHEVAKNLVLAGVGHVCVQDGGDVSAADVGAGGQFCVAAADAGKKGRAEATVEKLRELNPQVELVARRAEPDAEMLRTYHYVVATGGAAGVRRATAITALLEGDADGAAEPAAKRARAADAADAAAAKGSNGRHLTLPPRAAHTGAASLPKLLACGTFGLYGFCAFDLGAQPYTKLEKKKAAADAADLTADGDAEPEMETKKYRVLYPSVAQAFGVDWAALTKHVPKLYPALQLLCDDDGPADGLAARLLEARAARLAASGAADSAVPEDVVRSVAEHASHELSPVCAIVGGIIGAELIKLISGKDPPMNNVFLFDGHKSEGVVHRLGPSFDVDGAVDKGEATCLGVA